MFIRCLCVVWVFVAAMRAGEMPLPMPGINAVGFTLENGGSVVLSDPDQVGYVVSAAITDGEVVAGEGGADWKVAADQPFGKGKLDIVLERKNIPGDLAMVFNAGIGPDTNLAVQLFDGEGKALALDLFGDLGKRAQEAGTDTFVIPLTRYPAARTLVIRRLAGSFFVREVLLMSVITDQAGVDAAAEQALARALGEQLSGSHPLVVKPGLKLHVIPCLEEINEVGAAALSAAGYPAYQRLAGHDGGSTYAPVSGTVYDFAQLANRYLSLGGNEEVFQWFFTSSNGVAWFFENDPADYNKQRGRPEHTEFGMGSVPLSERAKSAFEARAGYPLIEFPIARNAIEVIVHSSNPLVEISMENLRKAFGGAGGISWDAISPGSPLAGEEVIGIGGDPDWGTGKVFQEIVLQGAPWRPDMMTGYDVVYDHGVEKRVSETRAAIGYAVQRKRGAAVKKLAIESSDGSGMTLATEDAVYSGKYPLQRKLYAYVAAPCLAEASPAVREMVNLLLSDEGQTMMVRSGSLPLAVDELLELRGRLGL
jgi:phosphate transport system substrate-binding protein